MARRDERGPGNDKMSDAAPESKVSYLPGARPAQSDEPASLTTTLAVLLHADVVDSTRIVQVDERVAHRGMRDAFERLARTVAEHDGQTREIRGDALVAQLHRASDAITAAIAFQSEHATHAKVSAASVFAHVRIGIALGEVVIADDTVTGAGIVLAQRVEQLAPPGGICVTAAVHDPIPARLEVRFDDLGEHSLKGFDRPQRVYRVRTGDELVSSDANRPAELTDRTDEYEAGGSSDSMVIAADKPSIAALAFENRSGDPEQEYFCDGLVEDVIVALSRFKALRVIACSSSFSYKGQAIDVGRVGRELGVRYVLTGSVRKSGTRIRLTAQLIDADSQQPIWSERFDAELNDVFDVQDRLTSAITAQIYPSVTKAQLQHSARKRPGDLNAWDLSLKAQHAANLGGPENYQRARAYAAEALTVDPECVPALGCNAWCYISEAWLGYASDTALFVELGIEAAGKAVAIDEDDAQSFTHLGYGLFYAGRHQEGLAHLRTGVELNENSALGWQVLGQLLAFAGAFDEALKALEQGMLLSPRDPNRRIWITGMSIAAFGKGWHAKGAEYGREAIAMAPNFMPAYRASAANLSALGRMEEARVTLQALETVQPGWSVAKTGNSIPFADAGLRERFLSALAKAGMPLA